jgi:hypothetical protein
VAEEMTAGEGSLIHVGGLFVHGPG